MDDRDLVEIEPATEVAYQCRWRATKQTPEAMNIGGMWFIEEDLPLYETCRNIFEKGENPQNVSEVIDLLEELVLIGAHVSQSDSHRFASEPFIPYDMESLILLGRLLAGGQARLRRSRITISHEDPNSAWDVMEKLPLADLSGHQRQILRSLEARRGRVGEPLEVFWQVICHLGVAQSAEEQRRDYGSGFIPKLKIDNHLFQIERKPLLEQIRQIRQSSCAGLVWIAKGHTDRLTLTIDFEALSFDDTDAVDKIFQGELQEMSRRINDAMSRISSHSDNPFRDFRSS